MMDIWTFVISLLALILTGGGMIVAGVWAVGRISGSVDKLTSQVNALGKQVDSLSDAVSTLDEKLDSHSERITKLEAVHEK